MTSVNIQELLDALKAFESSRDDALPATAIQFHSDGSSCIIYYEHGPGAAQRTYFPTPEAALDWLREKEIRR